MGYRSGPDTGYTSHELKRIWKELKRGNKKYAPQCILCPKCKGRKHSGIRYNVITEKTDSCDMCQGWGILRKN